MKHTFWKYRFVIALIIFPLLFVIIWFNNGLIHGGGDEELLFVNAKRGLEISSTTWLSIATGDAVLYWLSRASFLFIIWLFSYFFAFPIPNFILQAATFFLLMTTGILSVYFLIIQLVGKYKLKENLAFIGALFYLLNPYSMSQVWSRGQYSQYFSFALLPLILLLFIIAIKKRKYVFAPIIALITIPFSTAYGFATFIIIQWLVLFLYGIFIILNEKDRRKAAIFVISFLLICLFIWVLIHSWWLLPFLISGGTVFAKNLNGAQENISTLIGVSGNYRPFVLIRLLQDTYFSAVSIYSPIYTSIIFQGISILFPLFLFIGLLKYWRDRFVSDIRFFVVLFFLGLFVSLGANPPLGWLFIWIFEHVSFLQMFRNPYEKFGLVLVLGYAPLFALGTLVFIQYLAKRFVLNRYKVGAIWIVLFLLVNVFLWPMWTGKVAASPDGKIGIPIPSYYQELDNWLSKRESTNTRIFMTPLWVGDGAFYSWNGHRYQGVDPMIFFMNQEIIVNVGQIPFYYDLIQRIRQDIYSTDVSGVLSLFRVRYLINRSDAIFISTTEKQHSQFLTDKIYPPSDFNELSKVICKDQISQMKDGNPAWVACSLSGNEGDFHNIKYLQIVVKTDIPANLDLAIKDAKENRPNWYGKIPDEYALPANEWTTIIMPLGVPTEPNNMTDLTKIVSIDVRAHPFYRHNESVGKLEIKGIWLDPGTEKKVDNFKFVKKFDKLQVYEAVNGRIPPEFGILDSIESVNTFDELIFKSSQEKEQLDKHGFVMPYQNKEKDLSKLNSKSILVISDYESIEKDRYWIKFKNSGEGLVILSKTFNPEWKVISGVDKKDISGGLLSDLKLLKRSVISEENHYVVNGYANLWHIKGGSDKLAIVFVPQLYADIGRELSFISVIFISILTFVYFVWKFIKKAP